VIRTQSDQKAVIVFAQFNSGTLNFIYQLLPAGHLISHNQEIVNIAVGLNYNIEISHYKLNNSGNSSFPGYCSFHVLETFIKHATAELSAFLYIFCVFK
jgi:hypothetical protein